MSITLAHPSLTQPYVAVVLPDVEKLPASRPRRRYQQQFITDAGEAVIYDFGGESRAFSLELYPLSPEHVEALEDFFHQPVGSGGVNGRVGTFDLEDSQGRIYTVRFQMDVLEPQMRGVNAYAVTLTVREVQ